MVIPANNFIVIIKYSRQKLKGVMWYYKKMQTESKMVLKRITMRMLHLKSDCKLIIKRS